MGEIRSPNPAEIGSVIDMMSRFAAFEGLLEYMTADQARLHDAVFGENAFVDVLIAFHDDNPVGYAIFYPHFSSFRGESGYYLEDIYVEEGFRKLGTGKALLRAVARMAKERGFSRIDFQVLNWNENAISFYRSLGADVNDDERHFKFAGRAFEDLSS